MKNLKIKIIFVSMILIIMASLSFGLPRIFNVENKVYADSNVSISGWNDTNDDGIYECSVTGNTYSSKNSYATVKVLGVGIFEFSYSISNGTLTYKYNNETITLTGSGTHQVVVLSDSNELKFTCKAAKKTTATATLGDFVFTSPIYNITSSVNDVTLGSVEFEDGEYRVTTPLSIKAIPNSGSIFLGFADASKNLISTLEQYDFTASQDIAFMAVFAKIEGEGTESNPYNFDNVISNINECFAENTTLSFNRPTDDICNSIYVAESSLYTISQDGIDMTATNSRYELNIVAGNTSVISIKNGTKTFNFNVLNPATGLAGSSITLGNGTLQDPYLIKTPQNLQDINLAKASVYKICNDLVLTTAFTPIGKSDDQFTGTLFGNNKKITGLTMNNLANSGLFSFTNGGVIQDLTLNGVNITNAGASSGMLIGQSQNGTVVSNVHVNGNIYAIATDIGGIVGYSVNYVNGIKVSNSSVLGRVSSSAKGNIGGFSGRGGTFTDCVMGAEVYGYHLIGGFTGGYTQLGTWDRLKGIVDSSFTNCYMAGSVDIEGSHSNNYPYWGMFNGYGAYLAYTLNSSGQRISVNFTSKQKVDEIRIFGSNKSADGYVVPNSEYKDDGSFTQDILVSETSASGVSGLSSNLSETEVNGITSNYGGLTIRFLMEDGTYKYISTLNREESKFESNFLNINLDNYTSYEDNFANLSVSSEGTSTLKVEDNINIWGTVVVDNANDFEHLSWIINGAIPITIGGKFYNARSVITLSIKLSKSIDLTEVRYGANGQILNQNNGVILNQFYGFGKGEMYPYRGSIYGENNTLTVNMNFPNAYIMGIIVCSTEQSNQIQIENLTVEGTIAGKYRVGIVGMHDNYMRSCSLLFSNVTNNANITATHLVGGLLGEGQGKDGYVENVYITNCVNNGNIVALGGNAGGLVGSLNHLVCSEYDSNTKVTTYLVSTKLTITNSTNNGAVTATGIASGFISSSNNIEIIGDIVNTGTTNGSTKRQFFGTFLKDTTYSVPTDKTATLKSIYKINTYIKDITLTINDETKTSNNDGIILIEFIDKNILDGEAISVIGALWKDSKSYVADSTTMQTYISVPYRITFADENQLTTTNSSWEITGVVHFTNQGDNQNVTLNHNIDEELLNTNKLVFVNVGFTCEEFNVPSDLYATLSRITSDVKEYVTSATDLVSTARGENEEYLSLSQAEKHQTLLNLGTDVKSKLNSLITEFDSYTTGDKTRLENYISNIIANNTQTDVRTTLISQYFANIVASADFSNLNDVSVNYGAYEITKSLTFIMLDESSESLNIAYTFTKKDIQINNETLSANAATTGVSFGVTEDENFVCTYFYNDSLCVLVNKIDLLISIESKEQIYNGEKVESSVTLSLKTNDLILYSLLYNQTQEAPVNVGDYIVTITNITGEDLIYYNLPETLPTGLIKINPIVAKLDVEANKSFVYNKQQQATTFNISKQNQSSYTVTENDYMVSYSGEKSLESKPIDVGSYTATITFKTNNIVFTGDNWFNFSISPKQITDIIFDNVFTYNKTAPKFEFKTYEGLVDEKENIKVESYTIYQGSKLSDGINAGNYTIQINSISNPNYYVENLIKDFVVNQEDLEITLNPLSSTYGEELNLDELTYKITKGTLYKDENGIYDNLHIVAKQLDNVNAGEHTLSATWTNNNYDVTFVDSLYTINKKSIKINYGTTTFEYNGKDNKHLINPEVSGILDEHKDNFKFQLYLSDMPVSEFKHANTYTLKLIENSVTANYSANSYSQDYNINKLNITIKAKNISKNYNQEILDSDFKAEYPNQTPPDNLESIVSLKYVVCLDGESVNYTKPLGVNDYEIVISVIEQKELFNNYIITLENGTLKISERETYVVVNDIEKFYDTIKVTPTAKMFGVDNEEIANATFTYTYYKNGNKVEEAKEVGTYEVKVVATAGDNNKECEDTFVINIKTNNIIVTINNTNQEYNATAYTPDYNTAMNQAVDLTNVLSYVLQDENKNNISEIKNAGNYYIKFILSDNNFKLDTELYAIKISAISVGIKIIDREVTFGNEFDIQESDYSILSGNLLQDEKLDIVYSIANYQNKAGVYPLSAINKNLNYAVSVTNGNFVVNKRSLTVKFTGDYELEYSESGYPNLLNATVSNVVTDNAIEIYYLNSNNQQTSVVDAGTYYLNVEIIDTTNYKFDNTDDVIIIKEIVINKKIMSLDINLNNKIYDKENIILSGINCNNQEVSASLYLVEYYYENTLISAPKNAGKYSIKINEKIPNNYKFINNIKEFEIYQKETSIADISREYEYSRNEIKPSLQLLNTLINDDVKINLNYISSSDNFINVDNYKIQILGLTGVDCLNYKLVSDTEINYSIIPTKISASLTNNEFVFNNRRLTKEDIGLTFNGKLSVLESDYELSILPLFAGSHKIVLTSKNTGIEFIETEFDILIKKSEIQGITFENKTYIFDNQPHSIFVNKLTQPNGSVINVSYSGENYVDVGTYEISATLTNENYNTQVLYATLTITQAEISINVSKNNSFIYNSYEQGLEIIGLENLWYKDLITISYVGREYNSPQKPIRVGEYKLIIDSNDNIKVAETEFEFAITTKAVTLQNIVSKEVTYSAEEVEYIISYEGNIPNDDVKVISLYDGNLDLPINAKTYIVSFRLYGDDADCYHIQNNAQTTLTIKPYKVNVVADDKEAIYGDVELDLTFTSDKLLANHTYTGSLEREQGTNANSYVINLGTLSAGDNYEIIFKSGIYNIRQREIAVEGFDTEVVYNGSSQVPEIKFGNVLSSDLNVVRIETVGDTINCGTYTLKLVLLNYNYKLPQTREYTISILKKDISDVILGFVDYEKDYDGLAVEPFVLINGDYSYNLTYTKQGEQVGQIKDAGTYMVNVKLNNDNFKGERDFKFVVNKINYSIDVLNNARVIISSSKFVVEGIDNISVGTNNENFIKGNTISNLTVNTTYELFVKVHETTNYKETIFSLGEFTTSKSALSINEIIEELLEDDIKSSDIISIKQVIIDCENLSEVEKELLNEDNLNTLKNMYENYLNSLHQEIYESKTISDIVDLNSVQVAIKLPYLITLMGAGVMLVKEKKKDE